MIRDIKIDRVVNVRGLLSPRPGIIIFETLRKMRPGESLKIIGGEAGALRDIKAMCRRRRYCCLEVNDRGGSRYLIIEK